MTPAVTPGAAPATRRELRVPAPAEAGTHLLVLLLAVILTQRLAIPLGSTAQLAVGVPLGLAVVGHGLATRQLRLDPIRTALYCLAVAGMVGVTVLASARQQSPSLTSLYLAVAIYALLAVQAPALDRHRREHLLDAFVTVMLAAAVVALVQLGLQYLGVPGRDWLAEVVPQRFLLQGYHTGDPLEYGSPLLRANGVVFLEPSFLSYFLGLAAVVALWRGRGPFTIGLLTLGFVPTSAGNGIVVLALGIAALLVGRRSRNLGALLLPAAATVALAVATPFGARFVTRVSELGQQDSSANLRLVEPYRRFGDVWLADPLSLVVGHGPGNGPGLINPTGLDGLLTPLLPKLVLEYGLLVSVVFLLFLLWSLLAGDPPPPWTLALLVSYAAVNASFLQPTLAVSTILFVHLMRARHDSTPIAMT